MGWEFSGAQSFLQGRHLLNCLSVSSSYVIAFCFFQYLL